MLLVTYNYLDLINLLPLFLISDFCHWGSRPSTSSVEIVRINLGVHGLSIYEIKFWSTAIVFELEMSEDFHILTPGVHDL